MEKAKQHSDSPAIMQRIRSIILPPYFKKSSRRQFQQLPAQVTITDYEKLTLGQAVKKWKRVSWIAIALAMNILLWGFDTGIVGNLSSMPAFQKDFGEPSAVEEGKYVITSFWISVWAVGLPIGVIIGAAIGGWLQDFAGRKIAFMVGGGLSIGASWSLVATGIALGLEGNETPFSYRMAIATAWPFSCIPILLGIFLPESPSLLLRQDKARSAWQSFTELHGAKTAAQCEDLFEEMKKAVHEERRITEKARYIDCFKGTNLRRTMIVVFANLIPDLLGLTLLGNATYFVQQLGMDHSLSFVVQLVGILFAMIANACAFFTLTRFGRRTHILYSLAVITALWFGMGFTGVVERSPTVAWVGSAIMIVIIGIASLGAWPASFVVSGETSSLNLRAKTSGAGLLIGSVIRSGFDIGAPYLYNSDAAALNLGGKTGFVFAGCAGIGCILTWFVVPELKGRSAVEIDRLFQKRVPAWKFTAPQYASMESSDNLSLNIPTPMSRARAMSQGSNGGPTEYNPYEMGGPRSRAGSGASAFEGDYEMGIVPKLADEQEDTFSPASRRPKPFARPGSG